jgi:hypothetical protein
VELEHHGLVRLTFGGLTIFLGVVSSDLMTVYETWIWYPDRHSRHYNVLLEQ